MNAVSNVPVNCVSYEPLRLVGRFENIIFGYYFNHKWSHYRLANKKRQIKSLLFTYDVCLWIDAMHTGLHFMFNTLVLGGQKHYFQRCYLMKVELDECKWTHSLNHIFQATRINMAIEHLTNALNNEMNWIDAWHRRLYCKVCQTIYASPLKHWTSKRYGMYLGEWLLK